MHPERRGGISHRTEISWFCYSYIFMSFIFRRLLYSCLPQDMNIKVAIRGLPADTNPEEIVQEMAEKGHTAEYVRSIMARSGRPGCIFMAMMKRQANTLPGIYEVNKLLFMPGIKIEAWRGKKELAQCQKCQQLRHSSHNCHRTQRCVCCGCEHRARDYPRPKEDPPPTCANCYGPHTATNTSCPVYEVDV